MGSICTTWDRHFPVLEEEGERQEGEDMLKFVWSQLGVDDRSGEGGEVETETGRARDP